MSGMAYYIIRLISEYLPISFPGHCTFLIAGISKYPIVIYLIGYGVINYCKSIGTIFEMITFVVYQFWRHLMVTPQLYLISS